MNCWFMCSYKIFKTFRSPNRALRGPVRWGLFDKSLQKFSNFSDIGKRII